MNVCKRIGIMAVVFVTGVLPGAAADKTWLGVDGDWSNSANWSPSLPENGDTVIIGGVGQVMTNLLSGLTLNAMLFAGSSNVTLTGNALVLSDFIRNQGNGTLLTLDLPIQLNAVATNTLEATNSSILVSGQLSGDRALLIRGNNSRSAYAKNVYFIGTNLYSGGTRYDRWASGVISNEAALGSGPVRIDYGATVGIAIPNGGTISNEFSLATEDGATDYYGGLINRVGTNVLTGVIRSDSGTVRVKNVAWNGQLQIRGGAATAANFVTAPDGGSILIADKPISVNNGSSTWHAHVGAYPSCLYLAVTNNQYSLVEVCGTGAFVMLATNVLNPTKILQQGVSYNKNSRLDLNGFDQTVGAWYSFMSSSNSESRLLMSSTAPAVLTVNQANYYENDVIVSGPVSITKKGAGTLVLKPKLASTYTGTTTFVQGYIGVTNENAFGGSALVFNGGGLYAYTNMTLAATRSVTVQSNAILTVDSPYQVNVQAAFMGGDGLQQMTKSGSGEVILNGAYSATGTITVSAGVLTFNKRAALFNDQPQLWSAGRIKVMSGATAAFNFADASGFSGNDLSALVDAFGSGFTAGSTLGIVAPTDSTMVVSSIIANGAAPAGLGLRFQQGTVQLTAANTYTGITTIAQGATVSIASAPVGGQDGPLGNTPTNWNYLVFQGGRLRYTGPTATMDRQFRAAIAPLKTIVDVTESATVLTHKWIKGCVDINNMRLVKEGPGTLLLGFDGPVIPGGNYLTSPPALEVLQGKLGTVSGDGLQLNPAWLAASGPCIVIGDGAELAMNAPFSATSAGVTQICSYVGTQLTGHIQAMTFSGPASGTPNTEVFDVNDGASAVDLRMYGNIGIYPSGAKTRLCKAGRGTLLVQDSGHQYTGTTVLRAGRLLINAHVSSGGNSVLGNCAEPIELGENLTGAGDLPTLAFQSTGSYVVNRDLVVYPNVEASFGGISNMTALTVNSNVVLNAGSTFAIQAETTNATAITFAKPFAGAGSIKKVGAGRFALRNQNTYTGSTIISNGTLSVGEVGAVPAGSPVVLQGGSFVLNNAATSFGTLTVAGTGTIDVANTPTVHFAKSAAVNWGGTVIFANRASTQIYVGTDDTGLTQDQLSKVALQPGELRVFQASDGRLVFVKKGTVTLLR